MTRTAVLDVTSLEIDQRGVPIVWGRLELTQQEPTPGVYGLMSWELGAELTEAPILDLVDLPTYQVRAELANGEVLEGSATIKDRNGAQILLQSAGVWTGIAGW